MIMRRTTSGNSFVLTEGVCILVLIFSCSLEILNHAADFVLLNAVHPSLYVLEEAHHG